MTKILLSYLKPFHLLKPSLLLYNLFPRRIMSVHIDTVSKEKYHSEGDAIICLPNTQDGFYSFKTTVK
jgi:hypothetical protein